MQVNSIGLAGGLNVYGYAKNSPLHHADSHGMSPAALAIGVGIRVIGGRAVVAALGVAARRYGATGMVAACVLAGICTFDDQSTPDDAKNDGKPEQEQNQDSEIEYPDNPDERGDKFRPIKGTRGKQCEDGSVWERDYSNHGGDQWKRWPNRKSWERRDKPASVWPDGRIRK